MASLAERLLSRVESKTEQNNGATLKVMGRRYKVTGKAKDDTFEAVQEVCASQVGPVKKSKNKREYAEGDITYTETSEVTGLGLTTEITAVKRGRELEGQEDLAKLSTEELEACLAQHETAIVSEALEIYKRMKVERDRRVQAAIDKAAAEAAK